MDNYYELFSLNRSLDIDGIKAQLLKEKKKQINRQNSAPTTDKRYEAEKLLEKIAEAEVAFESEASRKEYDQKLSHNNGNKAKTQEKIDRNESKSEGDTINPNAKPSRKLYNGIDYDNGNFFKTEYGRYKVISYNDAFQEINDTMCKMIGLGPAKNQNHQSFYNEFLRIARIANTNRSKLDEDILYNSIFKCFDAMANGTDGSVANILAQNIFYYLNELYDRRGIAYDFGYIVASLRDWLFATYLQDIDYYREVVKAFYMAIKIDKAMPKGYYDLSYVTAENENSPDIYYMEITDYYAQKAIGFSENGYDISYIDTFKKVHELYVSFRENADAYLQGDKKRKNKLLKVYDQALGYPADYNSKSDFFIEKQPYNAGLAYAIGIILKNKNRARKAIKKLSFGQNVLKYMDGANIKPEVSVNKADRWGAIFVTVIALGVAAGIYALFYYDHPFIGCIVGLGAAFFMAAGMRGIVEVDDGSIGESLFLSTFLSMVTAVPFFFLLRRSHFIYLVIYVIIAALPYLKKLGKGNVASAEFFAVPLLSLPIAILVLFGHPVVAVMAIAVAIYSFFVSAT